MRLFVAIKTSSAVNAAVKNAASSLALFGSGAFCGAEMYHVTLCFIGESDRAGDIAAALKSVNAAPFELRTGALGHFGSTYFVSVEQSEALSRLQSRVAAALEGIGVETEKRPFSPHITVARRFKAGAKPVVFVPDAGMTVREMALMESKDGVYRSVCRRAFTQELN